MSTTRAAGLSCPACTHPILRVIDSRFNGLEVRRRRRCENCGTRVTTYEVTEATYARWAALAVALETIRPFIAAGALPQLTAPHALQRPYRAR